MQWMQLSSQLFWFYNFHAGVTASAVTAIGSFTERIYFESIESFTDSLISYFIASSRAFHCIFFYSIHSIISWKIFFDALHFQSDFCLDLIRNLFFFALDYSSGRCEELGYVWPIFISCSETCWDLSFLAAFAARLKAAPGLATFSHLFWGCFLRFSFGYFKDHFMNRICYCMRVICQEWCK